MKEDRYNVRISFNHGNSIYLECQGCGKINIIPGYDYFFQNSPIAFINYLPQLRRLGVTYKITNDKRGCYQTFDLSNYFENDPFHSLSNKEVKTTVEDIGAVLKRRQEEVPDNKEVVISSDTTGSLDDIPKTLLTNLEPVINNVESITTSSEVTEETTNPVVEQTNDVQTDEVITEPKEEETTTEQVTVSKIDLDNMPSKPDLLNQALSLGLTVNNAWSKRDLAEAINQKLSETTE